MSGNKKKTYFLDTNIFLRVLIKENKQTFQECFTLLQLIRNNQLQAATSSLVLAEIGWMLKSFYQAPKTKIITMLQSIINLRGLKIIDDYQPNLALQLLNKFNVKLIDAFIASIKPVARKEWMIISYDKDFGKLPVLWQEPAVVIKSFKIGLTDSENN